MEKNLIQRALELAGTGEFERIDQIERKLTAEGYSHVASHLVGPTIRRQLRDTARRARGETARRRGRPPSAQGTTP